MTAIILSVIVVIYGVFNTNRIGHTLPTVYLILSLIWYLVPVFFFTRPKVKEQFK